MDRKIFEKFGFVWNEYRYSWTRGNFKIIIADSRTVLVDSGIPCPHYEDINFYVAARAIETEGQLKNLFWALTGEQLTEVALSN